MQISHAEQLKLNSIIVNLVVPSCYMLLTFGMAMNEVIGSIAIGLALLSFVVLGVLHPLAIFRIWLAAGPLIWLIPGLALASTFWSIFPDITLKQSLWLILTVCFGLMLAVTNRRNTAITCVFFVEVFINLACTLINNKYYDGMTGIVSSAGIFMNKNTYSFHGFYLLVLSMFCFTGSKDARLQALAGGAFFLGLYGIIAARSVTIYLFTPIAIGTFMALSVFMKMEEARRRFWVRATFFGIVTLGGLTGLLLVSNWNLILTFFQKDPTLTGRTVLWEYADFLLRTNPYKGVGYQAFWVQGRGDAEYLWEINNVLGRKGFNFHNTFRELGVQLGYPGVIGCAVYFSWTIFKATLHLLKTPNYFFLLVFIILGASIALDNSSSLLFQPFSYNYFMFCLLTGLGARAAKVAASRSDSPTGSQRA